VTPFFGTHPITGTFCEFRNTLSADHFHNGVDIPKPDGSPVYSVYDGVVTGIGTTANSGTSAYVRVRYLVSGLTKTDAYVHIEPNPLLHIGDSVRAHQTVLGTILSGLGHVHFTHGSSGNEMNALRAAGGFSPYYDIFPPEIVSVRMFVEGTDQEFTGSRVSGLVDIRVHARDTNAGSVGDASSSTSNNGAYVVGYRVLSADRTTVVYEPPAGGVRFRFDRKPTDSDVHNAFAPGSDLSTPIYTVTNGNGADAMLSTRTVPNNAWDTRSLPEGLYSVMIFAGDTRGLADTAYVNLTVDRTDALPPAVPVMQSVLNDSTHRITLAWLQNPDPDLKGYRLNYTIDGKTWAQRDDETRLTPVTTSVAYENINSGRVFFRLTAVDSAAPANVSPPGDVYGFSLYGTTEATLIVDGFDRTEGSGSYHDPSHPFAMTHGQSVPADFATCSNEAVVTGAVDLRDYTTVVWVLGDESALDETFSPTEQTVVMGYLRQGGRLIVSGSEIAYDLDRVSGPTPADRTFIHDFLKVGYGADDANEYTVTGSPGEVCNGLSFRYGVLSEGSPYEEDWPDVLLPVSGGTELLRYGTAGGTAAVGFRGLFPGGTVPGGVITVGFPFETISEKTQRDTLMARFFRFFGGATDVTRNPGDKGLPLTTTLHQNYPNPFNPTTVIGYQLSVPSDVRLVVYDVLGREVAILAEGRQPAGTYEVRFDASGFASGSYFCRLTTPGTRITRTMMVLR
jgi:hypothetical protein